ncbi:hypothetical protein K493DRAFT_410714 [Basidiobolus meristosporus CBS 931.73]|uniref:Uncharacterized protein n=1 Tax=Basidiobolus meristosporus CBS 931.73 TaxID=1314790 RepID=A0A1Y1XTC4_9FUNG|nr:hypothetical protein K493DRAFT_410714 [Basidiobolus meristosporus CBS 931.73]|eukprot:ORX88963.1 hypothetical protein K493DRAFT_410714 [Basidiobolus meristosporus CBS 931.73]
MDLESLPSIAYTDRNQGTPSPVLTNSSRSTSPIATPTPSRRLSFSSNPTQLHTSEHKYPRASPRTLRRFGFVDPPQRILKPEPVSIERPVFKLSPQRPAPAQSATKPRPEWNNHFNSVYGDKRTSPKGAGTPNANSLDSPTDAKGFLKRRNSTVVDGDPALVEQLQRKVAKLRDRVDLEIEKRDTIERNLMIELASRRRFEAECRSKDEIIRELRKFFSITPIWLSTHSVDSLGIMLRHISQNHENLVVNADRRERDFANRLRAEREIRVHLESQVKQLGSMLAPEVMLRMLEEQIEAMDMIEETIKPESL